MQETWVRSLGWEDPLEKGKATHSSILAWKIPWLFSPQGHKELDMTEQLSLHFFLEKEMATHFRTLTYRIPWTEEPGRLQSMGSQEWDTT